MAVDPPGPEAGERHVLRGGSWYNNAGSCRSSYRYFGTAAQRDSHFGFRVVCEIPAEPAK